MGRMMQMETRHLRTDRQQSATRYGSRGRRLQALHDHASTILVSLMDVPANWSLLHAHTVHGFTEAKFANVGLRLFDGCLGAATVRAK